jgi:hypothetical protein
LDRPHSAHGARPPESWDNSGNCRYPLTTIAGFNLALETARQQGNQPNEWPPQSPASARNGSQELNRENNGADSQVTLDSL